VEAVEVHRSAKAWRQEENQQDEPRRGIFSRMIESQQLNSRKGL
jgi:hypothetical protein